MILLEPPADIFASDAHAIVIPTNCVGTNGAGLARKAAERWPRWDQQYDRLCRSKTFKVEPGSVHYFNVDGGRLLFAIPTKDNWRNPSRLEWVEKGLRALVDEIRENEFDFSIAVPALGCGFGELQWSDVGPLMHQILGEVEGADIRIYAPHPMKKKARS